MKIKPDTALLQARLHILRAKAEPRRMAFELDAALSMLELVWPAVHAPSGLRMPGEDREEDAAQ